MTKRSRRTHSVIFKAKVAQAPFKGPQDTPELARHTTCNRAKSSTGSRNWSNPSVDVKVLYAKIGQLTLENDFFLEGALSKAGGIAGRKAMTDRAHTLPISRHVELVRIARSSAYCRARPVSQANLMRRIDELHVEHPFSDARMRVRLLGPIRRPSRTPTRVHADEAHGH
ncbi:hypothetical protein [Ralstonia chuxiongensis]|uniref:hypothetical protein n=1 Tax=Ralstonia chuxiongensis TaxID=2957504 RepID=UPI0028F6A528|nr:hypothetical protein [Ralstonia chuxiongensis]CAJ0782237.1 hypothetical protein R8510_04979 [Ralstonia chuxiongensis]